MKLFICWSGGRGRRFAEISQQWLRSLFEPLVEALISVDIEKGAVWFEDLSVALTNARLGLICLTPEAIGSPWIHFEAGILAKALHEDATAGDPERSAGGPRIFPFVLGVEAAALRGPLTAYQSTSASDKDDVWRLIEAIAAALKEDADGQSTAPTLSKRSLHQRFENSWTDFQKDLQSIAPVKLSEIVPTFEERFHGKTFNESMYDCLTQGWLERYDAVRDVRSALHAQQATVRKACRQYVADMFDAILTSLDGYAMSLSVLLGKPEAPIKNDGTLAFEHRGVAEACERYRTRIKNLVARIADERLAPFFEDAFKYEIAETHAEKRRIVLRRTGDVRAKAFAERMNAPSAPGLDGPPNKDRCRDSEWELDRIVYYVWQFETWSTLTLASPLRCARLEIDRVSAGAADPFLLPLYHALQVLNKAASLVDDPNKTAPVHDLLNRTRAVIQGRSGEAVAAIQETLAGLELAPVDAASPPRSESASIGTAL